MTLRFASIQFMMFKGDYMSKKKYESKTIFTWVVILFYLPGALLISSLTAKSWEGLGIIMSLAFHFVMGGILIYENHNNPIFKKVFSKTAKLQVGLLAIFFIVLASFVSLILFSQYSLFKIPNYFLSLLIMSPPLILTLVSHWMRRSFEAREVSEQSLEANDDNEKEKLLSPVIHSPPPSFKEIRNTRKTAIIMASVALVIWIGIAHSKLAYDRAKSEAEYMSVSSSWESGGIIARAKYNGYLNYCNAVKSEEITNVITKMKKQLNEQYREKENSVRGLSFFNSLLNQSFGDSAYQKYMDKYGTNPYDALTGGLLSKAPNALGSIVSSNKKEELDKINIVEGKLEEKAANSCLCQFHKAFDATHGSWTILASTFGMLRPSSIEKEVFFQTADGKTNSCS